MCKTTIKDGEGWWSRAGERWNEEIVFMGTEFCLCQRKSSGDGRWWWLHNTVETPTTVAFPCLWETHSKTLSWNGMIKITAPRGQRQACSWRVCPPSPNPPPHPAPRRQQGPQERTLAKGKMQAWVQTVAQEHTFKFFKIKVSVNILTDPLLAYTAFPNN